jgi:ubiquinone/menaquinone biosynthesis C-methylase UbiE
VLDVGCGPGQYLRRLAQKPGLRLIAMDLSRGMLADLASAWDAAAPIPRRAVADIQALPLPDASLDVALAMHMLYHVPDIERAARELRRVLLPGGTLLAVTNAEEHLAELNALLADSIAAISDAPSAAIPRWSSRFGLENGANALASGFERIERRDASSELLIPNADPVLAYVESTRSITEPMLPDGATWGAFTTEIGRRVAATLAEQGVFRVRTHTGVFVCN